MIEESIRFLSNYCYKQGSGTEKIFCDYKLLDSDGKTVLTVDELLDRYIFNHKNVLLEDCFVKDYKEEAIEEKVKTESARKNIFYQQQILRNHNNNIFSFFTPPPCNNNFAGFSNNHIEESNDKAVIQKPTTSTSSPIVGREEENNGMKN